MSVAPVVFFVFKRPTYTKLFLDLIKDSGTKKIYVFADEGRGDSEKKLAAKVREIITKYKKDNKGLKIIPNFAKKNLGLKKNIIDGLNNVFGIEEKAIILEDDCLPHRDFFTFASEMLDRYQLDEEVMSITGTSVYSGDKYSYSFTKYQQCWGWATWARAWKKNDPNMIEFDSHTWINMKKRLWNTWLQRWYWQSILYLVKVGQINTWDFQWSYAHFMNEGLAIMPARNLITNIGFDKHASNTKVRTKTADMETSSLNFPLSHPPKIRENLSTSCAIERHFYLTPVAIIGMLRQYLYFYIKKYANRY